MLASKSVELAEVLKAMEEITDDEELWYQYLAREKALRDEISRQNWARTTGMEEEKNKIALNMLSKDMDVEDISELTELSVEEVLALKQKL